MTPQRRLVETLEIRCEERRVLAAIREREQLLPISARFHVVSVSRLVQRRCNLGNWFVSAGIEALKEIALLCVRTARGALLEVTVLRRKLESIANVSRLATRTELAG